jgi:adenylyltransferase/sulfurtransferase
MAIDQLSGHDLVVDCTDRPYTRYLISDATVLLAIPLVSGAAIGAAGQWAVYGQPERACYRCLWPQPGASQRCDEAGVWGPVTGMVGCAMAAEALRVLVGNGDAPLLHILHLGGSPAVRSVKMRPPSPKCAACGPNKTIASLEDVDYAMFCGEVATDESTGTAPGGVGERIGVEELKGVLAAPTDDTLVVDTRPPVEYRICALRNTTSESSKLQPPATGLTHRRRPTGHHPPHARGRPVRSQRHLPLPPRQRLADRRSQATYRPRRRARHRRPGRTAGMDTARGPKVPHILDRTHNLLSCRLQCIHLLK